MKTSDPKTGEDIEWTEDPFHPMKELAGASKQITRGAKAGFPHFIKISGFLLLTFVIIVLAYSAVNGMIAFSDDVRAGKVVHFGSDTGGNAAALPATPVPAYIVQATQTAIAIDAANKVQAATVQAVQNQSQATATAMSQQATAIAINNTQVQEKERAARDQANAPFYDTLVKIVILLLIAVPVLGAIYFVLTHWTGQSQSRKIGFIEVHKLRPDPQGNYEAYLTPQGQLVRPEPGNIVQPVPYNYSPNLSRSNNYAPHLMYKNDVQGAQLGAGAGANTAAIITPILPAALEIPGPIDFVEILASFKPQPDKIFLALGPGAAHRIVSSKRLFNIALAGATRQGKTSILRMMLAQLLFCGAIIYLTDPKYTDFDVEADEDWRPIRDKLARPPAYLIDDIQKTIRWISEEEIPTRLERRRRGERLGQPIFLAIDELPWIVDKWPQATDHISEILRIGSGLGVMVIGAAQDFLVSTIGGSGAVRDCYRTAFYVGGDDKTGRVLLDLQGTKGPVDDGTLGRGVALLRSDGKSAERVRIPFMSNQAIYALLGKPESPYVWKDTAQEWPGQQTVEPADDGIIFNDDIEAAATAANIILTNQEPPKQHVLITPLPAASDAMTARAGVCYYPGVSIGQLAKNARCSESTAAQVIRKMKKKQ